MKISRNVVALAAGVLLAGSAFAGNATRGSLHLYDTVTVEGKQLAPGNYKVEWTGSGPDVQVSILNGNNTVATLPAKVVSTTTKNESDGYSASKQTDGSNDLTSIFFHGQKFELQVAQQSAGATAQPAANGSN